MNLQGIKGTCFDLQLSIKILALLVTKEILHSRMLKKRNWSVLKSRLKYIVMVIACSRMGSTGMKSRMITNIGRIPEIEMDSFRKPIVRENKIGDDAVLVMLLHFV